MDEGRLAEYLSGQTGATVRMLNSRRIHSKYSRVFYAIETTAGRFIVSMQQGDTGSTSPGDELLLMQWLQSAGFPVAACAMVRTDRRRSRQTVSRSR